MCPLMLRAQRRRAAALSSVPPVKGSGMEKEMPEQGKIDRTALFCDETEEYRTPAEADPGDDVVIRFRTARDNVSAVLLHAGRAVVPMTKRSTDALFDRYEAVIPVRSRQIRYCFEVISGTDTCWYNKLGADQPVRPENCFRLTPGFHTPEWAKGAVIYQIFTDRFRNGSPKNDVLSGEYIYLGRKSEKVEDWNSNPAAFDVGRFYGGDLEGVEEELDYLQNLGVDVIYFNPLFVSPSNHKYDIQDYDHIDPHFAKIPKDEGRCLELRDHTNRHADRYINRVTAPENLEASNAYFAEFMKKVHARGMRVILDGVFNHCGSFNKWLDRERIYENRPGYEPGAYISADSPYRDYFYFSDENGWPYNNSYAGWWNHDTLPKLNYDGSDALWKEILRIGRKWVSPPYSVDGWRLDVAADLAQKPSINHQFWRDFRKTVKKANPDSVIIAEHYGDPALWMMGDQWDSVMNYDAFMEPVTWFLTGMEKHSDEYRENMYGNSDAFFASMNRCMAKFERCSLDTAMNELSNHDHSRFLTRTNRTVGRLASRGAEAARTNVEKSVLREAVIMQMSLPGCPAVYYADEAGQVGWTDPDNRRTYPWGSEDWELIEFHRYAIAVHKAHPALKKGSFIRLAGGYQWLAYGRFTASEKCVIIVNNNRTQQTLRVPVWPAEVAPNCRMVREIQSIQTGYNVGHVTAEVEDGEMEVTVGPQTAGIYVYTADTLQ